MAPTLAAGEFVLVDPNRTVAAGHVVVARHPNDGGLLVVKRVTGIEPDSRLILTSDNPAAGTDSRVWGPVEPTLIVGVVTIVLDRITAGDLSRVGAGGEHHDRRL